MKYKEYKRIYPKLKLSYSLYKLWVRQYWEDVWSYLINREREATGAMQNGVEVHRFLETHPLLKPVREIIGKGKINKEEKIEITFDEYKVVGVPDVSSRDWIVDYKAGTINGYRKQLDMYAYLKFCKSGRIPKNGLLVQVEGIRENGKLRKVEVVKTAIYELDDSCLFWEDVLYEMYTDLKDKINSGKLDKFLNSYI